MLVSFIIFYFRSKMINKMEQFIESINDRPDEHETITATKITAILNQSEKIPK